MSNEEQDKDRQLSLVEAAELYGFSPQYLRNLVNKGRLKARRIGYMWVTTPHDLEDFILSRQEKGVFREDIKVD